MISCTDSDGIGIFVVTTKVGVCVWMWALQKVVCSGSVHISDDYHILYIIIIRLEKVSTLSYVAKTFNAMFWSSSLIMIDR